MRKLIAILGLVTVASAGVYLSLDNDTYNKVKSGELSLYCIFEDGERLVDPNHIEGFDPGYGWAFFNGSAKNCRVE